MNEPIVNFEGEFEFLSNSYPSTFVHNGIKYKSVAHAYYSLKAQDPQESIKIREMKIVKEAISYGKKVRGIDTWQRDCRRIMKELLQQKFNNPFLLPRLLETGDRELGNGKNFVGSILMEIRAENVHKQS